MAGHTDDVGVTDMAPPARMPTRMTVKVETDGAHARISTITGSVRMIVPAAMVRKRMRPGESVAFFRATTQADTDVIELDERVEAHQW